MLGIEVLQKKNPARTSLAGRKILRGTTRFQEYTSCTYRIQQSFLLYREDHGSTYFFFQSI